MPKELWFVAGVNGAGKTTLAREDAVRALLGAAHVLNPDELVATIRAADPTLDADKANLNAAIEVTAEVSRRVKNGANVIVETVLSSTKYLDVARTARARGYLVGMIYVALPSIEYSIARVAERVASGGHAVPESKLRARWTRSHDNLILFLPLLDELYVFDNSSPKGKVRLVAQMFGGKLQLLEPEALPEVSERLQPLLPRPEKG